MKTKIAAGGCLIMVLNFTTYSLAVAQSSAQYPSRVIRVVVPFAPGGSTEVETRMYAEKVSKSLGQPVLLDNRPGAASSIGIAHVLNAAPDGYTLLSTNPGITVIPNFYPKLNAEVVRKIEPITQLSDRVTAIVVSTAALPNVRSIKDLIAYSKSNPAPLNCATVGAGGITHMVCASMSLTLKIPITAVHYKGAALGQVDLMAGRTQIAPSSLWSSMANIKRGALRPIAVLGHNRTKLMPELQTSFEQGANVDYPSWLGAFAPPGTPASIISVLHGAFSQALKQPDVLQKLEQQGALAVGSSPSEFRSKVEKELAYWKDIIDKTGIKMDE